MSQQPVPGPPFRSVNLDTSSFSSAATSSPSFWDRVSTWASENKAAVYTIAGVAVVVTGAGVVYYLQDGKAHAGAEERRASKKERRKAKKVEKDVLIEPTVPKANAEGNACDSMVWDELTSN